MNKYLRIIIFVFLISLTVYGEYFTIKDYNVEVFLRKNGVINVKEKITVEFSEPRHGIYRQIPFVYDVERNSNGDKAELPVTGNTYTVKYYDISTPGNNSTNYVSGKDRVIKIGDADRLVSGEKIYDINYTIYGSVLKFKNHYELMWNVIGNGWDTEIEHANFSIYMPDNLELSEKDYFVVTGAYGARGNNIKYTYNGNVMKGEILNPLAPREGVTAGLKLPEKFIQKDMMLQMQLFWMNNGFTVLGILLIIIVFAFTYTTWLRIGKDEVIPTVVQYEPPADFTPSEAGILIDDRLDTRDITCLIYYWAGNGLIEIEEVEGTLFGLGRDFILHKIGELPESAKTFEKTMFRGLFGTKISVKVSSLQNVFYRTMDNVRSQLDSSINSMGYYVKGSKEAGAGFIVLGVAMIFGAFFIGVFTSVLFSASMIISGIMAIVFGAIMPKKSILGNEKYLIIKGFKEFLERAEKPKIEALMKQDPAYFDKTLSFAIALGLGDQWASKFEGLMTEPPKWYRSNHYYGGRAFSTMAFSRSLNESMNAMNSTMYSRPESKTGGSGFSGGGGSSGGGHGGGGGGSW